MNVEIGTMAAQFLFEEYMLQIFGKVSLQCVQYNWSLLLNEEEKDCRLNDLMQETQVVCCFYSVLALLYITAQGKSYRHMYRRHNWFLYLNLIYCTQIVQFATFIFKYILITHKKCSAQNIRTCIYKKPPCLSLKIEL